MKQELIIEDISMLSDTKTIVIGDIHGCYDQLMNLLILCDYKESDLVVLTGDLVDRGPKPVEVLEWCLNNNNVRCVQGNHDNKLMRLMKGNDVKLTNGLLFTSNKIDQLSEERKDKILAVIQAMPNIIRILDINNKPTYVVHAGIDGRIPVTKQSVQNTLYMRGINPKNYMDIFDGIWHETITGEYNVICGHIVSSDISPKESIYCLDGGCCSGGVLRALVIENGQTKIVETAGLNILENADHTEFREKLAGQGLIRTDRLDDLTVYTYTDKAVHERLWDKYPVLRESRGHIFNTKTKECVAYTFPKFFNLNENEETQNDKLPWKDGYTILEKVDGWLGTLYRHKGKFKVASRGSFKSDGAVWATQWLEENIDLSKLDDEITLVFEIVSPITKIIVDYKMQGLFLLSAFNRHSGQELSSSETKKLGLKFGFFIPETYTDINQCFELMKSKPGNEIEGFVIRFKNNMRVKIKSEDYFRMSKLVKSITPLSIWYNMSNGKIDTNKFKDISLSPDLYKKALEIARDLEVQHSTIIKEIKNEFYEMLSFIEEFWQCASPTKPGLRKDFALLINKKNCAYKNAMFICFDSQYERLDDYVKKLIRPTGNRI